MKVKCITDEGGAGYIEAGDIYTVYSILMTKEGLHYLLSNPKSSKDLPMAHSVDMFVIVDHLLPTVWYFDFVGHDLGKKRKDLLIAIWGYKEMVCSPSHYLELIEREPEALKIFKKRKEEVDEYEKLKG